MYLIFKWSSWIYLLNYKRFNGTRSIDYDRFGFFLQIQVQKSHYKVMPNTQSGRKKNKLPQTTLLQLILVKFCHMFVCRYISNTYTSRTTERLLNAQPFYSIIKLMKKRCDKDVALFNWTYMIIRRHLDPLWYIRLTKLEKWWISSEHFCVQWNT